MSLDLVHYGSYSAWRKNALLIQKIRVLNASEIHEAYFARDLPQGNNLIRGLYDKHPTHSAGSKGSYDQSDIGTSKTSRKELSSKENIN